MARNIWNGEGCNFPNAQGFADAGKPCDLCCHALAVPSINKPAGKACGHLVPGGGGCSLHGTDAQPAGCRNLNCGEMVNQFGASQPHLAFGVVEKIVNAGLRRGVITREVAANTLAETRKKLSQ